MWLERILIVWNTLAHAYVPSMWHIFIPTIWDWLVLAGSLGFFAFMYLALRPALPRRLDARSAQLQHEERGPHDAGAARRIRRRRALVRRARKPCGTAEIEILDAFTPFPVEGWARRSAAGATGGRARLMLVGGLLAAALRLRAGVLQRRHRTIRSTSAAARTIPGRPSCCSRSSSASCAPPSPASSRCSGHRPAAAQSSAVFDIEGIERASQRPLLPRARAARQATTQRAKSKKSSAELGALTSARWSYEAAPASSFRSSLLLALAGCGQSMTRPAALRHLFESAGSFAERLERAASAGGHGRRSRRRPMPRPRKPARGRRWRFSRAASERYDIYCAPCHGLDGYGDGMVVQRGFPRRPPIHSAAPAQAPASHFYDVITKGYGVMYSYASACPARATAGRSSPISVRCSFPRTQARKSLNSGGRSAMSARRSILAARWLPRRLRSCSSSPAPLRSARCGRLPGSHLRPGARPAASGRCQLLLSGPPDRGRLVRSDRAAARCAGARRPARGLGFIPLLLLPRRDLSLGGARRARGARSATFYLNWPLRDRPAGRSPSAAGRARVLRLPLPRRRRPGRGRRSGSSSTSSCVTLFGYDWMMALQPALTSTVFGAHMAILFLLSALCLRGALRAACRPGSRRRTSAGWSWPASSAPSISASCSS